MASAAPRHPLPRGSVFRHRPQPSFRPDIQGLRAVAVLLVVASHVGGVPAGGYVGVDVFFVISGYLITGLLVRELGGTGRISLREFYARRVRRLLPMALLVLAASNLAAYVVFTPERAGQALRDALWSAGFLANVHFADIGTNYFDATRPASPVQHYWSLAVEEQFYLVWPWLLLALVVVLRGRWRRVVLAVGLLAELSLLWSLVTTRSEAAAAYFSTPARAYELAVGALLALLPYARLSPWLDAWGGAVLTWVGLAGIAAAAVRYDDQTPFPGAAALLPVAGAALVLLGGTVAPTRPLLRNPVLVNPVSAYVGRVSYSLYLWHWPVLIVLSALLPSSGLRVPLVLLVAAVLTVAGHHLVEEPVRRSRWLSRRRTPAVPANRRVPARTTLVTGGRRAGAVAAAAAVVVGGFVLPALALETTPAPPVVAAAPRDEPPAALRQAVADSVAPASWPALSPDLSGIARSGAAEWIVDRCDNVDARNLQRCHYGAPAKRVAALVGDSMAISYLPGLRAALEPRGWSIQVLTRNQCPNPLIGLWRDRPTEPFTSCDEHKRWVLDEVRRLRPQLVIASDSITFIDHEQGQPTGQARFAAWTSGLADFLGQLRAATPKVVVLGPPPRSGNLQSCVTRLSAPVDCTTAVATDWRAFRAAEARAAAQSGAGYVDPEPWFCAAGRCPAVVGSTPVYTDGRHLTAAYSRRLAPQLFAGLAPAADTS